ncbi:MAG: ATP-binding protein [bacterium]|nr:ATP-binding protein [bacterium]
MKLILALTSLAAMSIRNAQNFEGVKRSKEEWESTFDAITDSVAILDRDYRLVKVNKAYRESQRAGGDGLIGQTCHRLFYKKEGPCPDCPAVETLRTEQPAYAEKRVGEKIFRQWTYPIKNRQDDSLSVVMYTRDVTNLKTLKDRLVRSERMATIGQFAAGMAHEIRNPLGSIVTAADVLSTQAGTGQEDWKTLTDVMQLEAKRLNDIITEFLLYAAPRRPEIAVHDLNRLVEEMIPMIRAEAEQKGMHVESSLAPAVDGGLFDPDKMRQVIWNLVINGIQAMAMGQTLTVATGQGPDGIMLVIQDEGTGISETDRKRIFDPFFTTKSRGSGLGLSIVSRIVEDHEGRIEVASLPGGGTAFTVILPRENQETTVLREVRAHG